MRATTVLVKHFTHLLPNSPNPETALIHFREFLAQLFLRADWPDELASLENPQVLAALARLLGVSDFLWDDFLRMQHANLFPVVQDVDALETAKSRSQLQGELEATLRSPGPRLDWINRAMTRAVATGGLQLLMDLYLPLLVNQEKLGELRPTCLGEAPYQPLYPAHGHMNLLTRAAEADWELPYERLELPVLVMTGLQDRVFYEGAAVEALTARLPKARSLTLDAAGHLIPLERPADTIQALRDFAKGL